MLATIMIYVSELHVDRTSARTLHIVTCWYTLKQHHSYVECMSRWRHRNYISRATNSFLYDGRI